MFRNGLIHTVTIYPLEASRSNRTQKTQMRNDEVNKIENVRCRIVKHQKVMFEPIVAVKEGDVIEDVSNGLKYEILSEEYRATGFSLHHKSYAIRKKAI